MDSFDSVLELVDDFGTYQRLMLALVLLPGFIPCGFHAYNQLFMASSPDHWCKQGPWFDSTNFTMEQIKALSIPFTRRPQDGRLEFSQCQMYSQIDTENFVREFEEFLLPFPSRWTNAEESGTATGRTAATNASDILIKIYEEIERKSIINNHNNVSGTFSKIEYCQYGWNYDYSTYESTVVTEWDIVCDSSFLPTLALVIFGLGGLVGNYIFGHIQDRYGRRPAFFIYLTIQCVFGIATGLAPNFWLWLVFRVGVGFTVPAITGTPFVLALELVGPTKRTLCTIWLNVSYSLCLMALAGIAYLVRDWRQLAITTTVPFLIFYIYWWILPESPRWLFAHGKLREAETILRKMASVNGKSLPKDFRIILKEKHNAVNNSSETGTGESSTKQKRYSIRDLLMRGPVLRRNTLIITLIWFINMGVYVGLSYYAPALGGNEYWNFFLAGTAELPTYFFLYPCLDYWGRRWTLFGSMVLGGLACVLTICGSSSESWIILSLYGIGKFGISAGFVAIQQMAAEIYPTVVRGLGISFSNVIGMIGPALVPLINYTGQEYMYLPLLVLGALMVVGGFFGLLLPETVGISLPQSLEDAESLQMKMPSPCSGSAFCSSDRNYSCNCLKTKEKEKEVQISGPNDITKIQHETNV